MFLFYSVCFKIIIDLKSKKLFLNLSAAPNGNFCEEGGGGIKITLDFHYRASDISF